MNDRIAELKKWARLLRYDALNMIVHAKSGHPGGCLSAADMVACLYFSEMKIDPDNPAWQDRDRFILSKGHAAPILYAALARKGYFPLDTLKTLRRSGSILQGHPEMGTPGVDMTSGCLGEGLSAACGMALAARLDGKDYRTYVMMGCGEMNEGQVWESAMTAAHFALDNILVILDYNRLQFDGHVEKVLNPGSMKERWQAFGWSALEVNGHDMNEICAGLSEARSIRRRPTVIIADTIKGKGVPFMENDYLWHSLMNETLLKEYTDNFKKELMHEDKFYADRIW